VIVDMWNVHWCHSATTRVGELAVPMNATLAAARAAGIHIIFAPSDVTSFYASSPARQRTLALPNATQPPSKPPHGPNPPAFPLGTVRGMLLGKP
jgi:nicotinamidase-related amidase